MTTTTTRKPVSDYLTAPYPFNVVAESDGGYFVSFPDLPGCMTQVERIEDVGSIADEIRELWLETAYEQGLDIPEPASPAQYSGRFLLRLPRSLHRTLAESASREGVSLNHYATVLLARSDALSTQERRLDQNHASPQVRPNPEVSAAESPSASASRSRSTRSQGRSIRPTTPAAD